MEQPFIERRFKTLEKRQEAIESRIDGIVDLREDVAELQRDMSESFNQVGTYFKVTEDIMVTKDDIKAMATKEDITIVQGYIVELKATQADHREILLNHGDLLRGQNQKLDQILTLLQSLSPKHMIE